MTLLKQIIRTAVNIPGWHTSRKIVVIESDDWGSIRMPSKAVYHSLIKQGHKVDKLTFNRCDSLASETDLKALFEVLDSVKDRNGNPAVITANTIMTNPDFDAIKASGFSKYYYEPFTETLKRYPEHRNAFSVWKEGIQSGVFHPQFHGREHLNVTRWMKALQNNTGKVRLAFELGMYDISEDTSISENTFVDAFNLESTNELEFQKQSIIEGLDLFESIFGFRSMTMIPPCYIWSRELEETMSENGIRGIQGGWYQLIPTTKGNDKFRRQFNYPGKKNRHHLEYLIRNAHFEPTEDKEKDWVSMTLIRIETAFKCGRPAVISAHRLNFIGYLEPDNRTKNLYLLSQLLKIIVRKWPNVEFMSSDELVKLMIKKKCAE